MAQTLVLDDAASVTLNASGNGTATIGPKRPKQVWNVTNVAVSVSSNTLEPVAKLYLGSPTAPHLLGGTFSGAQDSTDLNVTMRSGNVLTVVWTGGDSGARATVSVYGTFTVNI